MKESMISAKINSYRREIRSNDLQSRFKTKRQTVIYSDLQDNTRGVIEKLSMVIEDAKISSALEILSGDMMNQRQRLADILLGLVCEHKKAISIEQLSTILEFLSTNLFFQGTKRFITNRLSFFDLLVEPLEGLHLMNPESALKIMKRFIRFFTNVTASPSQLNDKILQSELPAAINQQLAKMARDSNDPQNQPQLALEAKKQCLQMYANLFNAPNNKGELQAKVMSDLLQQKSLLLQHPEQTFKALCAGMRNTNFWGQLLDCGGGQIFEAIEAAIQSLQKSYHGSIDALANSIYEIIVFLNRLCHVSKTQCDWFSFLEPIIDLDLLIKFFIRSKQCDTKVQALYLLEELVKRSENARAQVINHTFRLPKFLVRLEILKDHRTGPTALIILSHLLIHKNATAETLIDEFSVLDCLAEALPRVAINSSDTQHLIVELIGFSLCLLVFEQSEERKIPALMVQKGIVKSIKNFKRNKQEIVKIFVNAFCDTLDTLDS